MSKRGLLLLDKTGTLTEGRLALQAWQGRDEARSLVLALEANSRHPIAAAFAAAWPELEAPRAHFVVESLGGGLEGYVGGRRVTVGAPLWVLQRASAGAWLAALPSLLTPVLVAVDGEVVAQAGFGDPLRRGARDAVRGLQRAGWEVRLLSGDAPGVVAAVAAELGLAPGAAEGGATPERKRDVVRAARAAGTVVMIGDGVNDAAAIAEASVGIAVQGGAEAAMASADVYLARDGIGALRDLVDGARRASGIVQRNIAIALAYNGLGVALAMLGVIDPLVAAILMPVSSVTVVLGAWQGRTFARGVA
jgi:Cu2+-exporting ATPase